MRWGPIVLALLGTPAFASAYPGAPAGAPSSDAKVEAKTRFDKAMKLFEEGDRIGALAELRRAFELTGNVVVLYNIGVVHHALGQYVEADAALTEALDAPTGSLKPEWRARAQELRTSARARIGRLKLSIRAGDADAAALNGAVIELDGIEVGRWPLAQPLAASVGKHVITVIAEGFAPARKEIYVAGEVTSELAFDLVRMAGKMALVRFPSATRGAEIFIDGALVGRTPVSSLVIAPGKHTVELRRPGYASRSTTFGAVAGATADGSLELAEDPNETAKLGSKLLVRASVAEPRIIVDGKLRDAIGALAIPPGPHQLKVEKGGYLAVEREVVVPAGQTLAVDVTLLPTDEKLADDEASRSRHKVWGYIGLAAGAALVTTGGLFVSSYSRERSVIDARVVAFDESRTNPSGRCNFSSTTFAPAECNQNARDIEDAAARNRTTLRLGIGAIAFGAVAAGLGVWSLATTPSAPKVAISAAPTSFGVTFSFVL